MRKVTTLTIAAASGNARMLQGTLDIGKGKKLRGLRLKCVVPIANASGGSVTLSDAQKQVLFSLISCSLRYGRSKTHIPLEAQDFRRVHRLARYCYGSEIEGYTDSTTGLGRALADGATTNVTFYMLIPTGMLWMFEGEKNFLGCGPSQCRTIELEINRGASNTILTGVTISGSVTVDVIPDVWSARGDQWSWIPEFRTFDDTAPEVELPDGFPLLVVERTAVHASSTLTNISTWIEDEPLNEQVSPAEAITEYNDAPTLPSAASLADRETLIYAIANTVRMRDVPSGRFRIRQNVKDLATIQLGLYYVPVKPQAAVNEELEHVARVIRGKAVKATSLAAVEGANVPERLTPFVPFVILDEQDPAYNAAPGVKAGPTGTAQVVIPPGVIAAAREASAKLGGGAGSAEATIRHVAAAIPGAVQSGRGFGRGYSQTYQQVAAALR